MAHSRQREYKADAGSVDLLGKSDMLSALRRLSTITENPVPSD
jgi:Zn-dependent protease with chaperone function